MENNNTNLIQLFNLEFCFFCGRKSLTREFDFEFYEANTYVRLLRDVQICTICNTVHYLERPDSLKVNYKSLYYIKNYSSNRISEFSWITIDAIKNKLKWISGEMSNQIFAGPISLYKNKHKTIEKENTSKPKKLKEFKNHYKINITGNLSHYTL